MNLQELDKMARRWPPETPAIIGRHETRRVKLQQARREQQPFTVPKPKDYGSEYPKDGMATKIALTIACLVAFSISILAFAKCFPDAVDDLQDHQRQVVAESRK